MVKQVRPARVRRRRERGTTLFVVVLAITMLTGIGLYTVRSAALLARAAGNERQATQTEYLAQIGALASLAQVSMAPKDYIYQSLGLLKSNNYAMDDCRMNVGVDTTKSVPPPCYELSSSKFALLTGNALFDGDSFGTAIDPSTGM